MWSEEHLRNVNAIQKESFQSCTHLWDFRFLRWRVWRWQLSVTYLSLVTYSSSHQFRESRGDANMMYSRAEILFFLERYFEMKSSTAVCEEFSNERPDMDVPNKTTVHWLVTTFLYTRSVCVWKVNVERQNSWNYGCTDLKTYVHQLQQQYTA
jgi:hypothetical protein